MDISPIFSLIILIISVIIHEVSHGYMALWLGDRTAAYEGRLTLNPIKHIDPIGSVVLPLLLYISHSPILFGWAKPVPYNPYNLRNQRWGDALVAAAGPSVNIIIALLFGVVIRVGLGAGMTHEFISLASVVVLINIVLALFNLVPIPPLDGSKIFFSIFGPLRYRALRARLEQYSIFLVLLFALFLWKFLSPLIYILFSLITSLS